MIDEKIMKELFSFIKEKTGITIYSSAPGKENKKFSYVIGHRVNTISINMFMRNLQIGFDSVSSDFAEARSNATKVVDAVNEWFDNSSFNLVGNAPEIGGMNDDGEKGTYVTQVTIQIGYLI